MTDALESRANGRGADQPRPVTFEPGFMPHAEGSVLIALGDTRVVCAVSVEEGVPPFLRGRGVGWLTAEYRMLPRSTNTRISRADGRPDGRATEIQRLIGRSLRACVDRARLGERTFVVDCDVLNADGGTRTAAITGGFVAVVLALGHLGAAGALSGPPLQCQVAAISAGIIRGQPRLDLDYAEDSAADVDCNGVMTERGETVEFQLTAERALAGPAQVEALRGLIEKGVVDMLAAQRAALEVAAPGLLDFLLPNP